MFAMVGFLTKIYAARTWSTRGWRRVGSQRKRTPTCSTESPCYFFASHPRAPSVPGGSSRCRRGRRKQSGNASSRVRVTDVERAFVLSRDKLLTTQECRVSAVHAVSAHHIENDRCCPRLNQWHPWDRHPFDRDRHPSKVHPISWHSLHRHPNHKSAT